MVDEAGTVRRPTLVTSDGQVGGTLVGDVVVFAGTVFELDGTVTGDLIVEFGGGAIIRGTVRGTIRRGGHVHLLGALLRPGELIPAAALAFVAEPFGVDPSTLAGYAVSEQEQGATRALRARRPNLDFDVLGIPIGAELVSTRTEATVTVIGPKRVRLGDEELSSTAATREVLQLEYSVAPGPFWSYQGKTVGDLYEEVHGE